VNYIGRLGEVEAPVDFLGRLDISRIDIGRIDWDMVEETTFKYLLAVLSILLCPENVLVPNLID